MESALSTNKRLEAIVHGRVQGVFFRASTRDRAQALGLTGQVRNVADGTVHVIAEGSGAALEQLLHFLGDGPPHASVTKVETKWCNASDEFEQFHVLHE